MKTKKSNLAKLLEASGNAVKILTDTIEVLKSTNEQIEDEKLAIATQIANLKEESDQLSDLRDKNSRIVANFEALLS